MANHSSPASVAARLLLAAILVISSSPRLEAQVPSVGPGVCVAFCGGGGTSGVGGFGGGGAMMGGMMAAMIGAMVVSAMAAHAQQQPASSAAQQGDPSRFTSRRPYSYLAEKPSTDPVQQALEQQRRFQEQRERKILDSMIDSPSLRLADSTAKMDLLKGTDESVAFKAGCAFDRGSCADPGSLWTDAHDAWYSTKPTGVQPAAGARPLALTRQPVPYAADQAVPIRCTGAGPFGGDLCSFPKPTHPGIKVPPISMSPQPSPDLAPTPAGSSPVTVLQTRIGDTVVAAGSRVLNNTVAASQNPQTYTNLMITWMTPALPAVQQAGALAAISTYKDFSTALATHVFEIMSQAVVNPDEALRKTEEFDGWVRQTFTDSMQHGKVARLSLQERPWEAFSEASGDLVKDPQKFLKDQATGSLRSSTQRRIQELFKGHSPRVRQGAEQATRAVDNWLFDVGKLVK